MPLWLELGATKVYHIYNKKTLFLKIKYLHKQTNNAPMHQPSQLVL